MASSVTRAKVLAIADEFERMINERYPQFEYDKEVCRTDGISFYFRRKDFRKGDWTIRISDHFLKNYKTRNNYFYIKHNEIVDEKIKTAINYLRWNEKGN